MGKNKPPAKNKKEKERINWLTKKVNDEVINGHIGVIYHATEGYIIYSTVEAPLVLSYLYNDNSLRQIIMQIMPLLGRLRSLFASDAEKFSYLPRIAGAYALCFDRDIMGARDMITDIINDIKQHRTDRNNAQLTYQGICFLFVVINIVIAIVFRYTTSIPSTSFWIYFRMSLAASFGGFLSVTYKLNKYEYDFNTSGWIRILSAVSRIFIAMLSGIIILWLIKSNIALGFLNDVKDINNYYLMFSFAVLSGFSESFIPDLLKVLEKKPAEVGTPVKQT